jgi:hypothetical protein
MHIALMVQSYKPGKDLNRVFANLSITTAFGGIFKVDAILAVTLCPALDDKLPNVGVSISSIWSRTTHR